MANLFELHEQTLSILDQQFAHLAAQYRDHMQCAKGCSGCCIDGFRIRWAEALYLMQGYAQAPPDIAGRILENLAEEPPAEGLAHCPLLVDGQCGLYAHRPALCRAFGVLIAFEGKVNTCDLNFRDMPETQSLQVLEIQAFYDALDEISKELWLRSRQAIPSLSDSAEAPFVTIREFFKHWLQQRTV